jgi:hypothetical protein
LRRVNEFSCWGVWVGAGVETPASLRFLHSFEKIKCKSNRGSFDCGAAATFAQDDKAVEFIEACGFPGLKIETWGNRLFGRWTNARLVLWYPTLATGKSRKDGAPTFVELYWS